MISRLVRIKPSVTRSFLHETSFDDIVLYIYAMLPLTSPPTTGANAGTAIAMNHDLPRPSAHFNRVDVEGKASSCAAAEFFDRGRSLESQAGHGDHQGQALATLDMLNPDTSDERRWIKSWLWADSRMFFGHPKTGKNDRSWLGHDESQNVSSSLSDEKQLCHRDLSTPIHWCRQLM